MIAEPDKASWDTYQAKAKASAAAREAAALGSKELQEKGLECSIDKRLFVEPTKTPCCQNTYCHECIINALLENDLRCPNCSAENILIDNLESDREMVTKIRIYEEEKAVNNAQEGVSNTAVTELSLSTSEMRPNSPSSNGSLKELSTSSSSVPAGKVKKRPADSELKSDRTPSAPPRQEPSQHLITLPRQQLRQQPTHQQSSSFPGGHLPQQPSFVDQSYSMAQGMNIMPFPNTNGYGILPMAPNMTMDPGMLNAMMMQGVSFMGAGNGDWANSWGGGLSQQSTTHAGFLPGAGTTNGEYAQQHFYGSMVNHVTGARSNTQGLGGFSNQQQTTFSAPILNEEDSAYFRKPVNPHRHQARRNVNRPTDYREI